MNNIITSGHETLVLLFLFFSVDLFYSFFLSPILFLFSSEVNSSILYSDCAREKCRTASEVECDGYGNYKDAIFTPHVDAWTESDNNTIEGT